MTGRKRQVVTLRSPKPSVRRSILFAAMLAPMLAGPAPGQEPQREEPAQLLPSAPEGWRFERMDLPADFAPDLPVAGFEELRFAPGMFEPAAPGYFSYALAVRSESRLEVDAAFLEDFLVRYYRGLCAAVGESRGMALDVSGVSARVAPGAHGFAAQVELFDAFTSGAPLTLAIEISVHHGDDSTELLGLASPAARDAGVWRTLRAMGRDWRAGRVEATYLNHVFLVVGDDSYAALLDSSWFGGGGLGASEERTTTQGSMTYTGLYVYGSHTYLEFLRSDEALGFRAGDSGVAFGFERAGGAARAAAALQAAGVNSFAGRRTRELAGEAVPWFEILGFEQPTTTSRLTLFALEYVPEFLARWHPKLPPQAPAITRHDVLERYAAALGQEGEHREALLGDLVEVRLALDEKELERFVACARALGLGVLERGPVHEVHGPAQRYVLEPSTAPGGVTELVLALTRDAPRETVELGAFTLELEGRRATLRRRP